MCSFFHCLLILCSLWELLFDGIPSTSNFGNYAAKLVLFADHVSKLDVEERHKFALMLEKLVLRNWLPSQSPPKSEGNVKSVLEKVKGLCPEVQNLIPFQEKMSAIRR